LDYDPSMKPPATQGTTWDLLTEAHQALRTAVMGIPADGWDRPTPAEAWNVTQVLQHAAGDQLAYASALTGGPKPAEDPFSPSGSFEGSPAELLEPALAAVVAAFGTVDSPDTEIGVPLPPFKLPAGVGVAAASLDAAIHAWDIAVATGQPSPLRPGLALALRPAADALVEPLRGFAFGPAIEPAIDADEADSLLNFLGRRADWRA
jgi:uncharacterized protein (TIGR03086 family)